MQSLFRKYLDNQCSPEEVEQLMKHFNVSENELELRSLIRESIETGYPFAETIDPEWTRVAEQTYHQVKKQIDGEKVKVVPLFKKTWFRIAASVIIILSALSWFFFQDRQQKEIAEVKNEKKINNDIKPGGDKAILTLADGTKIVLDNSKIGTIAQQGGANIKKTEDGQLAYSSSTGMQKEVLYNTVSTPRGGQYRLLLADGTKVWLNAASSIRFPNTFAGKERKVEITGEAYFEVAYNAEKPFRVNAVGMEVEVLGTHFNINAYDDEETVKTTLLEGSVKVNKGNAVKKLAPGEQALLSSSGNIILNSHVDVEGVVAWKNGMFHFSNADLKTVMRQLSRWYDVDVEYYGQVPQRVFEGEMQRGLMLQQVLKILEKNNVHFKIIGKKLLVMP